MAIEYITDNMAKGGIIRTGLIDINGRHLKISSDKNIGLLVNAPNSHVVIDRLSIEQVFKGVEFRAAKSITVREIAVEEFYNDAVQILASNVTIRKMVAMSTILKEYSNRNHSDFIQVFNHRTRRVENIRIDHLELYSRNHKEQANIHLTETHIYNKVFIGKYSFKIDTRAEYKYALSAINMSNSIIGGKDTSIGDLKIRVKDVKAGWMMSKNDHYVNIAKEAIEESKYHSYRLHDRYPGSSPKPRYLDRDISNKLIQEQARLALTQKW